MQVKAHRIIPLQSAPPAGASFSVAARCGLLSQPPPQLLIANCSGRCREGPGGLRGREAYSPGQGFETDSSRSVGIGFVPVAVSGVGVICSAKIRKATFSANEERFFRVVILLNSDLSLVR